MATPNYSKSEWASLSIQERIRAMNKVAGDDDSLQQSLPSIEDEQSVGGERPELPKRSSVVDIWRNREGPGAKPKKEKPAVVRSPSPVSVPWPDEEQDSGNNKPPVATFQQKKIPVKTQQLPKATTTPSWRSQLKSSSKSVVEEKEADLTILPSNSADHDEEVAAASHSKSVMDVWTKRNLTIADSPITVEGEEQPDVNVVSTPRRSSVVDIWTKRTNSGDVASKRSSFESTPKSAPPQPKVPTSSEIKKESPVVKAPTSSEQKAPTSSEPKKESPLKAWNRRKVTPKVVKDEDEADLVVVQDEEDSESPKAASNAASRYRLDQLRNATVPPRPAVIAGTGASDDTETAGKSSVPSSPWGSQLRKVQRNDVTESAEKSAVASPWGAQLRKVHKRSPSPVTTEPTVEDDESTDESTIEEQKPTSVVNRWKPQASGESPQPRKAPTKKPSPVVMPQSAEDNGGDEDPATEGPQRSSMANRWNPQGGLRRAPMKVPSAIVTEPSAEDADGDTEHAAGEPKHASIANRWNPQGGLRKVPPAIVTEPSTENADGDTERSGEEPKRPNSVAGRWNPQGSLASPQLRKVIDRVATPVGAERSTVEPGNVEEEPAAEEQKRPVVVHRWKPQGTEATPKRKVPIKVPPPIITESEALNAGDNEGSEAEEPKSSSVANRWNPWPSGDASGDPSGPATAAPESIPKPPKTPSVLDRYNPDRTKDASEPAIATTPQAPTPKSSVLDRYKPPTSHSTQKRSAPVVANRPKLPGNSVLNRYKPASTEKQQVNEKGSDTMNGWSPQVKQTAPAGPTQFESIKDAPKAANVEFPVEAPKVVNIEVPAEEPFIEPAVSIPFDESPTTKLFASIDMSRSSASDPALESEVEQVYDSTDADGFPSFSIEETKEEKNETPASGKEAEPSGKGESEEGSSDFKEPSEDKSSTDQPEENKPVELPKPVGTSDQRSKAMELFASRRKYQNVVKVQTLDANSKTAKLPLISSPKGKKPEAFDKAKFQSGTSAFTASPTKESGAVSSFAGTSKRRDLYKRPKSMKEFLKRHRLKGTAAGYSSVTSRSTASVGSVESSDKPASNKRTDLSVNTADENVSARESSSAAVFSSVPKDTSAVPKSVEVKERSAAVSSSVPKDTSAVPKSVEVKERKSAGRVAGGSNSERDASVAETDTPLPSAGATDVHTQHNEPGRIIGNTSAKSSGKQQSSVPSIVQSPSPRTRTLQERRRGHKKHARSPATPKAPPESTSKKDASPFHDDKASVDNAQRHPSSKPVQERAKAFSGVPGPANQATSSAPPPSQSKSSGRFPRGGTQPATSSGQGNVISNPVSKPAPSRLSQQYNRTQPGPVKPNGLTPVTSEAGASDTLTFFSAASSGYSTNMSNASADGRLAIPSPTSSLSNRASRALVRRRRHKPTKEEEQMAAQDLARRVMSHTIHEQARSGAEEEELSGRVDHTVQEPVSVEAPFFGQPTVPENDTPRGPGLSGRYNTSSRFMDSVQNIVKGVAPIRSFDSGTTEGSSQIRSVGSTSDSEAWMSGKMRQSASSSINRVPSDSTDGVSYQSGSAMTGRTGRSGKREEVVTEYFVSESSSNLDALKSAYKAVSLHQIAMDLTDEVSVATSVDLKKIASNLNEGMSAASSSLRSGLNNLNSGSSSTSNKRKLKVPTTSSAETPPVDEEVAIEVEYMEDSDEDGDVESPISARDRDSEMRDPPMDKNGDENAVLESPAGEPSQESSAADQRRAYV